MITMEGKYQTKTGRPVRILCVDCKQTGFPVVGLIGDYEHVLARFSESGSSNVGIGDENDLTPIPEPPKYIPYTYADWKQFIGKTVVANDDTFVRVLDYANVTYAGGMLYSSLFTDYTFEDGSIVGKLA